MNNCFMDLQIIDNVGEYFTNKKNIYYAFCCPVNGSTK